MTPTFAKIEQTKASKWKRSANAFEENVVAEELSLKRKQLTVLKWETQDIYNEIKASCSPLRFLCILKTIVTLRNEQYLQLMNGHIKKISRLLYKDNTDIDQHMKNISSYGLSFFQKLALCLNFALPQRVSSKDIQAAFEKAFWKLEPDLSDDNKELAAATLRSIALNYTERKTPAPPRAMLRAIGQLEEERHYYH